jgi:hypothetical protein
VPLIALMQPQGIAPDKMRFDMSIQITDSELKKATHEVDGLNAARAAFKVNLSPKTSNGTRRRTDLVDEENKEQYGELVSLPLKTLHSGSRL